MDRLWPIAAHEYRRHVLRRGFLIPLLSVPILLVIAIHASKQAAISETV